jgi:hypothetical protein
VTAVAGLKLSGKKRNHNIATKILFENLIANHILVGRTECTKLVYEDMMQHF